MKSKTIIMQLSHIHIYVRSFVFVSVLALSFGVFAAEASAAITYVGGTSASGLSANFSANLGALMGGSGSSPQEGDLVVVLSAFANDLVDGNPGVATAGYSEVADLYANDTIDANVSVSYKFMTGTPDSTVSCRGSGSASYGAACVVQVWRGVDSTTPMDVTRTTNTGTNSSVPNPPSITPVTSGAYVLAFGAGAQANFDSSVTAPAGYTNQVCNYRDPGAYAITACGVSKAWVSGAEDPAAWTNWTGSDGSWGAITVALRPKIVAVSGTLYSDEGITPITSGKTIKAAFNDAVYAATSDSNGNWNVLLDEDVTEGNSVTIWVDGDVSTRASLVMRAHPDQLDGHKLYKDRVIVRSEDGEVVTVDDLSAYNGRNDEDIQFTVIGENIFISKGQIFFVSEDTSFYGGENTFTFGGGVKNKGMLDLSKSPVYFASDGMINGNEVMFGGVETGNSGNVFVNDGATWEPQAATEANTWKSVTYGNGIFVAVSSSGTNRVMTSEDGVTWIPQAAAEANTWQSVTYGNGIFVAVSSSGSNRVMTSEDGENWIARSAVGNDDSWTSVTYGNGLFVAVNANGQIMTSEDGAAWIDVGDYTDGSLMSVTYGNGLFVAVGDGSSGGGSGVIVTSEDGSAWISRTSPGSYMWYSVTYAKGMFVTVGSSHTAQNAVATSYNGTTWTARTAAAQSIWASVTYGEDAFVAVSSSGLVMSSRDGILWTPRTVPEANTWQSIAYGNGIFVAVSSSGTNRVMTSDSGNFVSVENFKNDGVTWESHSAAVASDWHRITYGNGIFVAVSFDGDVMTSPDGITWTQRSEPESNEWQSVTYGNGIFVAVSSSGTNRVMTSPDGIAWTARTATEANDWFGVTYGNGLFVAVSFDGTNRVMTSPDGITWMARTAAAALEWTSVTYGNGLFVAVAESGTDRIMTSPNGTTWTLRTTPSQSNWYDVVYGEGLFVAVSTDGHVMTSPNGTTWTSGTTPSASSWYSVAYGGGLFVAVAFDGDDRIMTSEDGITWIAQEVPEMGDWHDVVYGNGMFVSIAGTTNDQVMISNSGVRGTADIVLNADATIDQLYITADSTVAAPPVMTINTTFYNEGVFDAREGAINAVSEEGGGFDLANATYDEVFLDVTETNAYGMDFSRDGEHLYVLGYDDDNIRWYTLSTAWDISTASYEGQFYVGALDAYPNAIYVSDDGTRIFFTGDNSDAVGELSLSVPYDVTTSTFIDAFFLTEETKPFGLAFNTGGTRMYISGDDYDSIHSYVLSSPWDVVTAVYEESFSFASQDTSVAGIHFGENGTRLFMFGWEDVFEYALSTPFDISTASFTGSFSSAAQVSGGMQVKFSAGGAKMYILDADNDVIYQYTTGILVPGLSQVTFAGNLDGISALYDLTVADVTEVMVVHPLSVHDLTVGVDASVSAPATVNITGDLTNNGVLTTAGEVTFTGAGSTISGKFVEESAFNELIIDVDSYIANNGVTWIERSAAGNDDQWLSLTYANDLFVAVGLSGDRVMTSPDGVAWTARSAAGNDDGWRAVTYGNGLFVAVGWSNDRVMTSEDGLTWTARSAAGDDDAWYGVAYGNGLFVAVGSTNDRVMISEDGINWTALTVLGNNDSWRAVTFANGLFVAVSSSGDDVMTSPDGIEWTSQDAPGQSWRSVTYGEGLFVAVGYDGTAVMTSPDGIEWTARSAAEDDDNWRSVTYGNGLFVAVSESGDDRVMTSPDGITWTARSAAGNDDSWESVAFNEGRFVAVGVSGDTRVMTSESGELIDVVTFMDNASTTELTILSGEMIAPQAFSITGDYHNGGVFTHAEGSLYFNGESVQDISGNMTGTSSFNTVIFSGSGDAIFSDNADTGSLIIESESELTAPSVLTIRGDFTNNGTFNSNGGEIVVTGSDQVFSGNMNGTSAFNDVVINVPLSFDADGTPWVGQAQSENSAWSSIAYGEGLFVALAYSGTNRVMTSPDGVNWTSRSAAQNNSWNSMAYGNGTFVAVAGNGTHQVMTSEDGITWVSRTAAAANEWYSVTYGNGLFVAVAHNSISGLTDCSTDCVMTSPDGVTWTPQAAAASNKWERVIYGEGLFVAVSSTGEDLVMTSPDGINWTSRTVPGNAWYGLAYGNGTFVAVAYDWVMTSENGINWTSVYTPYEDNGWQSVTYGGGLFVAVSPDGDNRVMTSEDGLTWTPHSAPNTNKWWDVVFGADRFVAVAQQTNAGATCTTNCVMISDAGDFYGGFAFDTAILEVRDLTLVEDSYVAQMPQEIAVTGNYANRGTTVYSTYATTTLAGNEQSISGNLTGDSAFATLTIDTEEGSTIAGGTSWAVQSQSIANYWTSVAYGNGTFVAVATDGSNRVVTSQDGITWTAGEAAENNGWQSVTYGNGQFVAVAYDGEHRVMTSPDGITWTARSASEYTNWYSVAYGNGIFVAVSYGGTNRVMTSPDGITWTPQAAAEANAWQSVTCGNGLFVAVSSSGTNRVMTSPDGITWTPQAAAEANEWKSVTYGNGMFVAVSRSGTNRVMTSPDGITWTSQATGEARAWNSVTYGNGLFVAVSLSGTNRVMTSPDGITWTPQSAAQANEWTSVTYGNGLFVAVSSNGINRVMTSSAGSRQYGTVRFQDKVHAENLVVQTPGVYIEFPVYATSTFTSLTLDGAEGGEIMLRSSKDGSQWGLGVETQVSVSYVDVSDSHACSGSPLIVAASSTDSGNNRCWDFGEGSSAMPTISSHTDQVFALGQPTTTISTITITDAAISAITAENDIRIAITENDMKWDTENLTAIFGGSASGKVSNPVSFEQNGSVLVIPVSADFSAGETLTISGLSFSQFMSVSSATTSLHLVTDGETTDLGSVWTTQSVLPYTWRSIAYGNNHFVVVGSGGTVLVSEDGVNWNSHAVLAGNTWESVVFGNGLFVAVSSDGANRIATSRDGVSWASRTAPEANSWRSLTFGNGLFVAVSSDGANRVITSPDGITWTSQEASEANTWNDVTYGEGLFVAVSNDGTNRVMISEDGIEWTSRSASSQQGWVAVAYGEGRFVATGWGGEIMTSENGLTWTTRTSPGLTNTVALAYGNGTFVSLSSYDATSGRIRTSEDGITWFLQDTPEANGWSSLVYAKGKFVAVAVSGTNRVMTSSILSGMSATSDDKKIAITGALVYGEHDQGQSNSVSSFQNKSDEVLYRFKLTPNGETMSVSQFALTVSGVNRITPDQFTDLRLYRDHDADGEVSTGDAQVGGAGTFTILGQAGSITWNESWGATTSLNYIVTGDVAGVSLNEYLTLALERTGVSSQGDTLQLPILPYGSVSKVQHIREGARSAGSSIGAEAPEGDGDVGGGGSDGGGGVGEEEAGETIGNDPGFRAPAATGNPSNGWTNGTAALISDGVYATASQDMLSQSYSLFGFNIPSGNSIQGIEVKIEASVNQLASGGSGMPQVCPDYCSDYDVEVFLSQADYPQGISLTLTDTVQTLGGASDLWFASWDPEDFTDENFTIMVLAPHAGLHGHTIRIDAIQVRVYHQATGGGAGGGGGI